MEILDKAIVLNKRAAREADGLVSFYTENHGKVVALGRGLRRVKSKMAGHLESFGIVSIRVVSGKEVNHLAAVELIQTMMRPDANLARTLTAASVLSLADLILREGEADSRIFHLFNSFLAAVSSADNKGLELSSCHFYLQLLACLGYSVAREKSCDLTFIALRNQLLEILKQADLGVDNRLFFAKIEA